MTVSEIARKTRGALAKEYGQREAGSISWIILEHLTGQRRGQLIAHDDAGLVTPQLEALQRIVDELLAGRPLQYVLGETEFFGLRLKVNPSVLIPRPETEELVDWVLRDYAPPGQESGSGQERLGEAGKERRRMETAGGSPPGQLTILDIGTGSGCIAIALARHLPAAAIWACDVSEEALRLATENAGLNHAQVRFEQVDLLDEQAREALPAFDLLVSNPPYVTRAEMEAMATNVLEHEPHLALFVENDDPLLFYREIATFAGRKLCPGGKLYLEINEAFGGETCELLKKTGLHQVELRKDLHGKDRMIKAVR